MPNVSPSPHLFWIVGSVSRLRLSVTSRPTRLLCLSSVHGILQARTPEWVALSSSRGSSQARDRTRVSCIEGGFPTPQPLGKSPSCRELMPLGAHSGLAGGGCRHLVDKMEMTIAGESFQTARFPGSFKGSQPEPRNLAEHRGPGST